eukprot:6212293-Pleurochrysis_carterae.AAC.1
MHVYHIRSYSAVRQNHCHVVPKRRGAPRSGCWDEFRTSTDRLAHVLCCQGQFCAFGSIRNLNRTIGVMFAELRRVWQCSRRCQRGIQKSSFWLKSLSRMRNGNLWVAHLLECGRRHHLDELNSFGRGREVHWCLRARLVSSEVLGADGRGHRINKMR